MNEQNSDLHILILIDAGPSPKRTDDVHIALGLLIVCHPTPVCTIFILSTCRKFSNLL